MPQNEGAKLLMDAVAGLRGKVEVAASKVDASSYKGNPAAEGARAAKEDDRQREELRAKLKNGGTVSEVTRWKAALAKLEGRADALEPSPFGRQERNAKISESSKEA